MITSIVNTDQYPLDNAGSDAYSRLITGAQRAFSQSGALQLDGFIRAEIIADLMAKLHRAKAAGHRMQGDFPPYSEALDDDVNDALPADHPARLTLPASHLFLPGDMILPQNPLRILYRDQAFQSFMKQVLNVQQLHAVEDTMGDVNLLVYEPGDENGWHFDTTDFVVSIMLQCSSEGGLYQYLPDLRSEQNPNFHRVAWRMKNPDAPDGVQQCDLQPGTLFLFKGKYTMHRVTRVAAQTDRVIAILSYHPHSGHTISNSSKRAMYGRESPIVSTLAI